MTENNRSGQSLIEFCLFVQMTLMELGLLIALLIYSLIPMLIKIDVYEMARVHLYGNQLDTCRMSEHWPQTLFQTELVCKDNNTYTARVTMQIKGMRSIKFEEQISLKGLKI